MEASRTTQWISENAKLFYLIEFHVAGEEANGSASDKGLAGDFNQLINVYRQRSKNCASLQILCYLTPPHYTQAVIAVGK